MQSINALVACFAFLLATVFALPSPKGFAIQNKQFAGNPFEVTHLTVDRVEASNVTMVFTVHNPDPLSNKTVTCSGTWPYGSGGWPSGKYDSCSRGTFAWTMKEWTSWTEFSLDLKDTFKDPDVGPPPYDQVTIFGTAEFTSDVMTCQKFGNGTETCLQAGNSTVRAPIDRTVA